MRYYSFDGSYLWAKIDPFEIYPTSWSVYLPDGTVIEHNNGIQRIKDTNGNKIKIWTDIAGSVDTTHYQDELTGREIKHIRDWSANTGQVQYQTVGGTWVTIDINWGMTHVFGRTYQDGSPCELEQALEMWITVVRSIVLPQTEAGQARQQFTFSYNSDITDGVNFQQKVYCQPPTFLTITSASHGWGGLSQMVTPAGATVNYAYSLDGVYQLGMNPSDAPREGLTSKSVTHDGTTDTWTYFQNSLSSGVTNPDDSFTFEYLYPHDPALAHIYGGADGRGGLIYKTVRGKKVGESFIPLVTTERHWTRVIFSGGTDVVPGGLAGFNAVVDVEYTTLHNSSGTPTKMSAKLFQHDYNGNVTQVTEYDWFDPNSVSRDAQGVPTGVPNNPTPTILRVITNSYYNPATTSTSANAYAKRTLPSGTPLILNALQQTTTGPSQTQLSYDGQAYGTAPMVGNLTQVSRLDNSVTPSQWRNTTHTYNSSGNKTSTTDPNGNVTSFHYDTAPCVSPNRIVVDPLNGTGQQTTTLAYDYSTGLVTSQTDPNGKTTETDYTNHRLGAVDPYGRPGTITGPAVNSVVGGVTYTNQRHKTKTTYYDSARQVVVEADLNTEGDAKLKTRTTTDQLGRVTLAERNEDGTTNYTISAQTVYVQMGKIILATNPKRSTAAGTDGWARTTRDNLGRVIEVATFSGVTQPPDSGTNCSPNCAWTGSVTTSYNANETTVTDQAGKVRKSVVDGLGRLAQVIEDPSGLNYQTNYTYDSLGNLRRVQQGTQWRYFAYDSLSRLIYAKNPEQNVNSALVYTDNSVTPSNSQWSMAYSYDPNSNLTQKTDARSVTATYTYDGLNRNTGITYNDGTPAVTRSYDQASLGKGRLWRSETATGNGTRVTITAYDALGQPLTQEQQFFHNGGWSQAYTTQRSYNLAGGATAQTYPSGRTVTNLYDAAGRLNSFSGNLGGTSLTYASDLKYNAAGQMTREQFGTTPSTLYHRRHFNARGQLYDVRVGTDSNTVNEVDDPNQWTTGSWDRGALRFYFSTDFAWNGGVNNNGNVWRMDHVIPLVESTADWVTSVDYYGYDSLNRITGIWEQSYSYVGGVLNFNGSVFTQQYLYDRWGNRTVDNAVSNVPGVFNLALEVETTANRLRAPSNDCSGSNPNCLDYDAAGNQTKDRYTAAGGGGNRSYDAENRVKAAQGGGLWHYYVYDADGRRVRRTVGTNPTVWQVYGVEGELVTEYTAGTAPTSPTKEYGYRNGQLLVTAEGSNIKWLVGDHLGTPRMIVDKSGSLTDDAGTSQVYEGVMRHDYLPFGEEVGANVGVRTQPQGYTSALDTTRQKFTGKERDQETGIDFMEARYYSATQGRFTSPDYFNGNPASSFNGFGRSSALPYAMLLNPQTLNHYVYGYNNPLSFSDPDGHMGKREKFGRYTIRVDKSNPNDAPNIHVFDGKKELGRVALKETGPEFTGELASPKYAGLQRKLLEYAESKGIRPRTPNFGGGTGARGGRGGGASNILLGLTIIQLGIDILSQESDKRQLGYHVDFSDKLVIDDLNKAVNNLPRGTTVDIDIDGHNYHFILIGKHFITFNPNCERCILDQDKEGEFRLKGQRTCCD